jgi:hypothetical protein
VRILGVLVGLLTPKGGMAQIISAYLDYRLRREVLRRIPDDQVVNVAKVLLAAGREPQK